MLPALGLTPLCSFQMVFGLSCPLMKMLAFGSDYLLWVCCLISLQALINGYLCPGFWRYYHFTLCS